eukprot:scaffold3337_cov72-Isochrysis_galbana.AAC.2
MADSARPQRSGDAWPHDARETKAHHWATPMQQQPVGFHFGTATSAAALQRYQLELEQHLQHKLSWQLQGSPVLQAMPPSELGWPYSAAASAPFKRPLPLGPLNHLTYQLQAPQPQPQPVQMGQLYLHGSHQHCPAAQPPPLPAAMPPFTPPFTSPYASPFTPGHGAVAGGARLPTRAEGQSSSPAAHHRAEESRLQGVSKRVEAQQRCEEARRNRCEEARKFRCEEARQSRCGEARQNRCEEARQGRCEEARNVRCEEARDVRCKEARMVRCEEGHPPPEAACHDLSAAAVPPSASPASRCGKGVDCPAPAGDLPPTPAQGEARGTPAGIPGPPSAPPPTVHPPAPCSSPAVSPAFARPPSAVSPAGYRPAVGAVAACAAAAPGVAAGVIFGCNDKTFDECFELCIVGLPNKYMPLVQSIRAGCVLSLCSETFAFLHPPPPPPPLALPWRTLSKKYMPSEFLGCGFSPSVLYSGACVGDVACGAAPTWFPICI